MDARQYLEIARHPAAPTCLGRHSPAGSSHLPLKRPPWAKLPRRPVPRVWLVSDVVDLFALRARALHRSELGRNLGPGGDHPRAANWRAAAMTRGPSASTPPSRSNRAGDTPQGTGQPLKPRLNDLGAVSQVDHPGRPIRHAEPLNIVPIRNLPRPFGPLPNGPRVLHPAEVSDELRAEQVPQRGCPEHTLSLIPSLLRDCGGSLRVGDPLRIGASTKWASATRTRVCTS